MEVFNVKFVGEVEKYPELYNYTLTEYTKRDATERAWNLIAKEVNLSVNECKEKWRNLRSTFVKHLKPKENRSGVLRYRKPYYLMDAMKFAIPFVKARGIPSDNLTENIQVSQSISDDDVGILEDDSLSTEEFAASPEVASLDQRFQTQPSSRGPHGLPIRKRSRQCHTNADKAIVESLTAKKPRLSTPNEACTRGDAIRHFLLCLVPDLTNMNDFQLRRFKRRTLLLVDEIYEDSLHEYVTHLDSQPASQEPENQRHPKEDS